MDPFSYFRAWLYSREQLDNEEKAGIMVHSLFSNPRFAPNLFGEAEPYRRLPTEKIQEAISLVVNRSGQELDPERVFSLVMFERKKYPACSYSLGWSKLPHRAFEINSLNIQEDFIKNPQNLDDWIGFVLSFLNLQKARFALFALDYETKEKNFLHWRTRHPKAKDPEKGVDTFRGIGFELTEGIPGLYWGNYFSPFYVDWFGRNKLDNLPCYNKRWLTSGGIFFTTASTPFEWNLQETIQREQVIKEHLGEDAFFDIESVRHMISELEPIPEYLEPEKLQSPRRVPEFPFKLQRLSTKVIEKEMEEAISFFTSKGFLYEGIQGKALIFRDKRGGITRITLGNEGKVEYWP